MSLPPEQQQITTTTRAAADIAAAFGKWLVTTLAQEAEPAVTGVQINSGGANGMSSETVLLDAEWSQAGERALHELVIRLEPDPSTLTVFPTYDMSAQFRAMATIAEREVAPVPPTYWCETDPTPLGAAFLVMGRVEGQVPPDNLPYTFGSNWLAEAGDDDRRRLQDSSVDVLARLHGIEDAEEVFPYLVADAPGDTPLRRHVAAQRAYYEWTIGGGARSRLLESCFAWLDDHWPHEGPTVLSWGDARIGNVIYRDFEPAAVLDWEMASLAPREVDLAWFAYMHRMFQDLATGYGMPGLPDFLRYDDVVERYTRASGYEPRDMLWFTMYAALRYGVVIAQTMRRAIRFGEAQEPADPDDMLMNRPALEAILAGTYSL